MSTKKVYFEVLPKILPAGSNTTVNIRALYSHCAFNDSSTYEVTIVPMEVPNSNTSPQYQSHLQIQPEKGALSVSCFFAEEQEYRLIVREICPEEKKDVVSLSIYALEKDLYGRYPYKGDMHMHTCHSDGVESPGYVAASCRKIGLDFMAITDHGRYYPSILAQEAFKDVSLDMKIFRGEEVHPPENPLHIINFGGKFSINEFMSQHKDKYYEEVEERKKEIKDAPNDMDKYHYASSVWVFNKIREAEGLGIFCHPYWVCCNPDVSRQAYYISSGLITHLFDNQPYDAFELLGGYYKHESDSNTLQVARYNEERAKGKKIPVVGVSDAHGCERELFGWFYSIVFSPDLELPNLIHSIKDLYSVAVEALPGECVRVYGPFRLVKYALFLLREVFPKHDELCYDEGRLMLEYESGNRDAAGALENLRGQTASLMKKIYK